jgi:hypothetical protein
VAKVELVAIAALDETPPKVPDGLRAVARLVDGSSLTGKVIGLQNDELKFLGRQLADTNRDGTVDELDTCVPVGGFINGLRLVGLALELIDTAEKAKQLTEDAAEAGRETTQKLTKKHEDEIDALVTSKSKEIQEG